MQDTQVQSLGQEDSLEEETATHSSSLFFFFNWRLITLQYCRFCHTSTWISYECTCPPISNPPPDYLPTPSLWVVSEHQLWVLCFMHRICTGHLFHVWLIYMSQCHSLTLFHPRLLPQSPKVCSLHLCLFCWLAYRVVITAFLNSIYMR